ncbi:Peptide deformylase [Dirofilaria immitis]
MQEMSAEFMAQQRNSRIHCDAEVKVNIFLYHKKLFLKYLLGTMDVPKLLAFLQHSLMIMNFKIITYCLEETYLQKFKIKCYHVDLPVEK